jgi:hypothetical protein
VREEDLDMSLIFFDVSNGLVLWTSDDGVSGSKTPVDFNPYGGATEIGQPPIAPVEPGVLLWGHDNSSGNSNLFFWDGTDAPIELSIVPNAYTGNGLNPQYLTPFNGAVYFSGQYLIQNDYELWSSGGNTKLLSSGLYEATDTNALTSSNYNPQFLATAFGQLFFNGNWTDVNGNSFNGLVSYTTANGAVPIPNLPGITTFTPYCLAASPLGSAPYNLGVITPFGGFSSGPPDLPVSLLMGGTGSDGATVGLYAYDGSALTLVTNGTATGGINPVNPVSMQWDSSEQFDHITLLRYNSAVFFSGVDGYDNPNRGLWMSAGTEATTIKVQGSWTNGVSLDPYNLTPLNGKLYFTGYDSSNGPTRGLFSYDPVTKTTTHLLKSLNKEHSNEEFDLSPNYEGDWNGSPSGGGSAAGNGSPFTMAAFNNKLYFNCNPVNPVDPTVWPQGLYYWDPATDWDQKTQTALPPTLVSGTGGSEPICLTVVDFG